MGLYCHTVKGERRYCPADGIRCPRLRLVCLRLSLRRLFHAADVSCGNEPLFGRGDGLFVNLCALRALLRRTQRRSRYPGGQGPEKHEIHLTVGRNYF